MCGSEDDDVAYWRLRAFLLMLRVGRWLGLADTKYQEVDGHLLVTTTYRIPLRLSLVLVAPLQIVSYLLGGKAVNYTEKIVEDDDV